LNIRKDDEGYYVSPDPRDMTPEKIYACLPRDPNACITTHWGRASLFTFTEEWADLLDTPAEVEHLAQQGIRFRYPEQIEDFLDEGHLLTTTRFIYRRDTDNGHILGAPPSGWTGPWTEVL
jgi:hypothetical protein